MLRKPEQFNPENCALKRCFVVLKFDKTGAKLRITITDVSGNNPYLKTNIAARKILDPSVTDGTTKTSAHIPLVKSPLGMVQINFLGSCVRVKICLFTPEARGPGRSSYSCSRWYTP